MRNYTLYKEFGWTPEQVDEISDQHAEDLFTLIRMRAEHEQREQQRAQAQAQRGR